MSKNQNCSICGSTKIAKRNKDFGDVLCGKHAHQWKRHGKFFKRTIYDKNDIIVCGKKSKLILRNKLCKKLAEVIFDTNDIDKVRKYKWWLSDTGYAMSGGGYKKTHHIRFARFVLNAKHGIEVDHINGNKLDNRRCNLRIVNHQQNSLNKKSVGVYKYVGEKCVRFRAYVGFKFEGMKRKKSIYLGSFKKLSSARKARLNAEKKYFGEFRRK